MCWPITAFATCMPPQGSHSNLQAQWWAGSPDIGQCKGVGLSGFGLPVLHVIKQIPKSANQQCRHHHPAFICPWPSPLS